MEEKRKVVSLEIDEEEEEDMEMETKGTDSLTRLPAYVPPWMGKEKVPKDLYESKSSLQTPLLPEDIIFERVHLGWVPSLMFEDQDLADNEKFPHLATAQLMKPEKNTMARVIDLEPHKWLREVEEAGLLNLLWVAHYHRTPITIVFIMQLLCMVHEDSMDISKCKSNDLAIAKAMKAKFKLEK